MPENVTEPVEQANVPEMPVDQKDIDPYANSVSESQSSETAATPEAEVNASSTPASEVNDPSTPERVYTHDQLQKALAQSTEAAVEKRMKRVQRQHDEQLASVRSQYEPVAQPTEQSLASYEAAPPVDVEKQKIVSVLSELHAEQQQVAYKAQIEADKKALLQKIATSKAASNYADFDDVVYSPNPVNDNMEEAMKTISDPGAFLYHAAKHHREELTRIFELNDPRMQYAEVIRLEGRMKSGNKNMNSEAPRPITLDSDSPSVSPRSYGGSEIDKRVNADQQKYWEENRRPNWR